MRDHITEWLSNIHHRLNIAGEGEITKVKVNQFVNFPLIMRNINITNSKEMIRKAIVHYMKANRMKVDGESITLTQL
jgi:hypothetical protein